MSRSSRQVPIQFEFECLGSPPSGQFSLGQMLKDHTLITFTTSISPSTSLGDLRSKIEQFLLEQIDQALSQPHNEINVIKEALSSWSISIQLPCESETKALDRKSWRKARHHLLEHRSLDLSFTVVVAQNFKEAHDPSQNWVRKRLWRRRSMCSLRTVEPDAEETQVQAESSNVSVWGFHGKRER